MLGTTCILSFKCYAYQDLSAYPPFCPPPPPACHDPPPAPTPRPRLPQPSALPGLVDGLSSSALALLNMAVAAALSNSVFRIIVCALTGIDFTRGQVLVSMCTAANVGTAAGARSSVLVVCGWLRGYPFDPCLPFVAAVSVGVGGRPSLGQQLLCSRASCPNAAPTGPTY
jgi:hypothetical protein